MCRGVWLCVIEKERSMCVINTAALQGEITAASWSATDSSACVFNFLFMYLCPVFVYYMHTVVYVCVCPVCAIIYVRDSLGRLGIQLFNFIFCLRSIPKPPVSQICLDQISTLVKEQKKKVFLLQFH